MALVIFLLQKSFRKLESLLQNTVIIKISIPLIDNLINYIKKQKQLILKTHLVLIVSYYGPSCDYLSVIFMMEYYHNGMLLHISSQKCTQYIML